MHGKFRTLQDIEKQDLGFAVLSWICHPDSTGAKQLTLIEGRFAPGQEHSFHKHPDQEEILYILAGKVELWIGRQRRILEPGEAAFMPPGTVHAAFNAADTDSRLLAILGPSVGDAGLEMVDLSGEAPWNDARAQAAGSGSLDREASSLGAVTGVEGKFRTAQEVETQDVGIATLRWISHPASTGARQLTVIEATFAPGQGHSFHRHPDQEEMVYVVSGKVEQWVDRERRILGPGDGAFLPAGTVHASFNAGDGEARLIAAFGPCVGAGFETTEMASEAPWNTLRMVEPAAG